jgi:hypothetical protein
VVLQGISSGTPPTATITVDGLADDALLGSTYQVAMVTGADGTWTVQQVQRTDRCARGVSADGTLCT